MAFEVSAPANRGFFEDDFLDLLRIATVSVDRSHAEMKRLVADA